MERVKTLHLWDESGKIKAKRTSSNHRYYTEDDVAVAKGLQSMPSQRKVIVYCRVSSREQKQELQNQQSSMEQFCLARGLEVDEYIVEIGEKMNFKRRQFLTFIVVAHKDRLCRLAIVHCFFCRLYGSRTYANQKVKAVL